MRAVTDGPLDRCDPPDGEDRQPEHHAGRQADEVELGQKADGDEGAQRDRAPACEPALKARARQKKTAAETANSIASGVTAPEANPSSGASAAPRPPTVHAHGTPGSALAYEEEHEQRRESRHQRAQQPHQLEAIEHRAVRPQVVGDAR